VRKKEKVSHGDTANTEEKAKQFLEGVSRRGAETAEKVFKPVRRRGPLVGTVNIVFAKTIPVMTSMPLLQTARRARRAAVRKKSASKTLTRRKKIYIVNTNFPPIAMTTDSPEPIRNAKRGK
jgi:hypothetical protein